jgi:hypothetical protein
LQPAGKNCSIKLSHILPDNVSADLSAEKPHEIKVRKKA